MTYGTINKICGGEKTSRNTSEEPQELQQKILTNNCVHWLFIKKIDKLCFTYWKFGKKTFIISICHVVLKESRLGESILQHLVNLFDLFYHSG